MKNAISLFPMLNEKRISDLFKVEMKFEYIDGLNTYPIALKEEENSFYLEDERGVWTSDQYDWTFHIDIECLTDNQSLFGPNEGAVARSDAIIGLGLQWFSRSSRQRNTKSFGEISSNSNDKIFSCDYTFCKASLKGEVGFRFILYIKEPGNSSPEENFYANTSGYIVGNSCLAEVQIDGNGSCFSIFEVSKPGESLWWIECELDDPRIDDLSESVSVCINRSHPSYRFLDYESPNYNKQLFLEIMSSTVASLIEAVRSLDVEFQCLQHPEEGSVAQAILYFTQTFEWDLSNPVRLMKDIHKTFEQRLNNL